MTVDSFMLRSGLVTEVELTEDQRGVLALIAEDFLRCGGRLSLDEYHALSDATKEALRVARGRLDDAMAFKVAASLIPSEREIANEVADVLAQESTP